MSDCYIVDVTRTAVGKAPRGVFRHTQPDDLLVKLIQTLIQRYPQMDDSTLSDMVIGCAMPEGAQGMNIARIAGLRAGLSQQVPAMTINRFCSSGIQSIATAAASMNNDEPTICFAGGVESMSMVPLGGHNYQINPAIFNTEEVAIAYGMGITAEIVAKRWHISRESQDEFAFLSHQRALTAIEKGYFIAEITPFDVVNHGYDAKTHMVSTHAYTVMVDEGPRKDTSLAALSRLKPVFSVNGSVTAGNSSQTSDGAGIALLANEKALKAFDLVPMGRLLSFAVAGVPPEVMGIGPVHAIPLALKKANLTIDKIDWIELNEAFAAQALAVIQTLELPMDKVNPQGGAIALGHPLGATGTIRTATLMHGLKRQKKRYGMVTMCIGTGMGAAAIFEAF